jgi:hypothetical protein
MPPPAVHSIHFTSVDEAVYTGPSIEQSLPLVRKGVPFETLLWLCGQLWTEPLGDQAGTRVAPVPRDLLRIIGKNLYAFLFGGSGDAETAFRTASAGAEPLDVQLLFDRAAWPIAQLPWEFLYVPAKDGFFLSAPPDKQLVLTRHVPDQPRLRRGRPPLRILVVVSSPQSERARVDSDIVAMLERLHAERLEAHGPAGRDRVRALSDEGTDQLMTTKELVDVDWDDIQAAIGTFAPNVVHFVGHGEKGALWLAKAKEEVEALGEAGRLRFSTEVRDEGVLTSAEALRSLFPGEPPQLVVLDACESDHDRDHLPSVAHLLVSVVPAVVAMRHKISGAASETFMEALYRELLAGACLDHAVLKGRQRLAVSEAKTRGTVYDDPAFGTPVLYLGQSEALLDAPEPAAAAPGPPQLNTKPRCPRCQKGEATGRRCEVCGLFFVCRNKACGQPLKTPVEATICSVCDSAIAQPPWPPGLAAPAAAAGDAAAPAGQTAGFDDGSRHERPLRAVR